MLKWLENAIIYQVYPTSFYDSNGDGIGDLKGIEQKVDYIKGLGVDCVWINPIFKSPFKDGGYDITDFLAIDKRFGTMEDLQSLIDTFHKNGLKVILDLVVGHTSDKHEWFKKSACAKRNQYSDYYLWTDSLFQNYPGLIRGLYKRDGGYLPNYYASQPGLNFGFEKVDPNHPWQIHYKDDRLKPLREEIINIMRYYLDMGIDGWRVDMAGHIIKGGTIFNIKDLYSDSEEGLDGVKWFWNEVLGTLRKEYKDKAYIAEWVMPQRAVKMCGFDLDYLAHETVAFNSLYRYEKGTNLVDDPELGQGDNYFSPNGKGSLDDFIHYINYLYPRVEGKGYFSAPTGTHDMIRMGINKSPDLIKTIFAFMLTFKQVPLIYYGDELGMTHNFAISKDGGGVRTGSRTPMQWTEGFNRGFSTKKTTYLPASKDKGVSVEAQEKDENSILNVVRKLVKIRKTYPCLFADADQTFIESGYPAVFERTDGKQTMVIMINPSDKEVERTCDHSKVVLSQNADINGNKIKLNAQSFVLLLK